MNLYSDMMLDGNSSVQDFDVVFIKNSFLFGTWYDMIKEVNIW